MKVYFQSGEKWKLFPDRLPTENSMLALSFNNWNDYGICTTFNAILYIDKKPLFEFGLQILIENNTNSPAKLNELRSNDWDGFFPIPDLNYVSVPSDIDFYNILISKVDEEEAINVLKLIRDAGYLKNVLQDPKAITLTESGEFSISPLRESGARKAFEDGWKLFVDEQSSIKDFSINIIGKDGAVEPVSFVFNSELLPYDINVLIGENGVGKSYTLKMLVEYWLGVGKGSKDNLEEVNHIPFDHNPNISKLILVSYSPFEEFAINLDGAKLKDKDAYKYFGFRRNFKNKDEQNTIGISRNLPASDSVFSILKSIDDDIKFGGLNNWINKFETIVSVLSSAIEFDFIALEIDKEKFRLNFASDIIISEKYIKIDVEAIEESIRHKIDLIHCIMKESGVIFIKDNQKVELSSGQRLFCYIVVNVVGQIRKDSLVVIDEPELFLHPTLEIEFIELLKKILKTFTSKAILATHSLTITREIPARCVHIYRKRNGRVEVEQPPFETFGGDIQRISSYVFGDNVITKPFDNWIENILKDYSNPDEVIEMLGKELNEEMLIKILNTDTGNG